MCMAAGSPLAVLTVLPPYGVCRFRGLLKSCGVPSLANQSTIVLTLAAVVGAPSAVSATSAQSIACDPVNSVLTGSGLSSAARFELEGRADVCEMIRLDDTVVFCPGPDEGAKDEGGWLGEDILIESLSNSVLGGFTTSGLDDPLGDLAVRAALATPARTIASVMQPKTTNSGSRAAMGRWSEATSCAALVASLSLSFLTAEFHLKTWPPLHHRNTLIVEAISTLYLYLSPNHN